MSAVESNNRLNHRLNPGQAVTVRRKGSRPAPGEVVTNNPDGSYGVRVGTHGKIGRVVECQPVELTKRDTSAPVTYRRQRDRKAVQASGRRFGTYPH